jgi:TonB family protein
MFQMILVTIFVLFIPPGLASTAIIPSSISQKNTVDEHIDNAREAIKGGQYSAAKNELNAALKIKQDSPKACLLMTDIFYRESKVNTAIEYATKAIGYDPAFGEAYYFLGSLLYKSDKTKETRDVLETGLKNQPQYALLHILKGDLELASSKPTKGLKAYDPKLDSAVKAYEEAVRLMLTENKLRGTVQNILSGLKNYIDLIQHEGDPSYVKVKPLNRPSVNYPDAARRLGRQGEVSLGIVVNEQGQVIVVQLFKHLGHGIDEAAVEAAQKIQYSPALKAGKPVSSWSRLEINFQ